MIGLTRPGWPDSALGGGAHAAPADEGVCGAGSAPAVQPVHGGLEASIEQFVHHALGVAQAV